MAQKLNLFKCIAANIMDYSPYSYILSFPLTIPNVVWLFVIVILSIVYVSTYHIHSENAVGKVLKYSIEYGKCKSIEARSIELPKSYFTHYYIFASIWNVACFITIVGLCFGFLESNWIANLFSLHALRQPQGDKVSILIVMTMITIHTMGRLYECLFVSVFSTKLKINLLHYLWGFTYYLLLPPALISECLPLNKLDFGFIELRHICGIVGFLIASFIQHQTHIIFANLRKNGGVKQESHGIPQGGMFHLISCPHYFAEVLKYVFTLVIVRSQCHSWWLVLMYNAAIHINVAMGSHVWYKKTFQFYPKERKALIPYLC